MSICFLVDLPFGMWQWDDGLRGAMRIIEKDHKVCYHLDGNLSGHTPDLLMAWGGSHAPTTKQAKEYEGKSLLFFAGGEIQPEYFEGIDIVLFENEIHTLEARAKGIRCLTAFGTDTTIFHPIPQKKMFDVIYPGAFGRWKRKELFAQATKRLKAFTLGNIQYHEPECLQSCIDNDIAYSADIPQSRLPYFYAMAHTVCVLPVSHIGGQRTVLEAMAMKLPVIVPSDAPLVCEFARHGGYIAEPNAEDIERAIVRQIGTENTEGYEYVMEHMTERDYAKKIKIAMERI